MNNAIAWGHAPLLAACLVASLAAGCRWFQPAPEVGGVRVGETVAEVQKRLGAKAEPMTYPEGRLITMMGPDGGALFVFLDDKDRVKGVRVTTTAYPGTPEGLRVGDKIDKMIAVYGKDYVVRDERRKEGYVYHYRRGGQHLAFVFEREDGKRIQRIFVDQDMAVFKGR